MSSNFQIAVMAAFGWGVLSILLSPCHLSSIPLLIGYLSNQNDLNNKRTLIRSFLFALGILITIALIGIVTATMGRLLGDVGFIGNIFVATIFLIMGLYLLDLLPLSWNFFNPRSSTPGGIFGAFILGLLFGIGLGPCTFAYFAPVLGVVFSISQTALIKGLLLVSAFGFGHCSIIMTAGSLTGWVGKYLNWSADAQLTKVLKKIAGILVILGGIYFISTNIII
jgi:cytochrome c-type biogenesis protein